MMEFNNQLAMSRIEAVMEEFAVEITDLSITNEPRLCQKRNDNGSWTSYFKYSLHIIVHTHVTTPLDLLRYVTHINKEKGVEFFDPMVYSTGENIFRFVNQHKVVEIPNPKYKNGKINTLGNHTIGLDHRIWHKYIITYTDDNSIPYECPYDEVVKTVSRKEYISNEFVDLTFNEDDEEKHYITPEQWYRLEKLLFTLPEEYYTKYNKWFKVACSLYYLSSGKKMFELFERFSARIKSNTKLEERAKHGGCKKQWKKLRKKPRPLVLDENGNRVSGGYRTIHALIKDHRRDVYDSSVQRRDTKYEDWKKSEKNRMELYVRLGLYRRSILQIKEILQYPSVNYEKMPQLTIQEGPEALEELSEALDQLDNSEYEYVDDSEIEHFDDP